MNTLLKTSEFKEVHRINFDDFNQIEDVLYYTEKDFYIVPNWKIAEFAKSHPDSIYFIHRELVDMMEKKFSNKDLKCILYLKRLFHPTEYFSDEQCAVIESRPIPTDNPIEFSRI